MRRIDYIVPGDTIFTLKSALDDGETRPSGQFHTLIAAVRCFCRQCSLSASAPSSFTIRLKL